MDSAEVRAFFERVSGEWMRTEQADLWLGFAASDVERFFAGSRLLDYGYDSLGMQ